MEMLRTVQANHVMSAWYKDYVSGLTTAIHAFVIVLDLHLRLGFLFLLALISNGCTDFKDRTLAQQITV